MHTCPMVTGIVPHVGGPVIMGSPNVITAMMPQARVTDQCVCVGPPDIIVKGSTGVLVNGLPAARMGDLTAHGGVIVMGAFNVMIGEVGGGSASPPVTVPASSVAGSGEQVTGAMAEVMGELASNVSSQGQLDGPSPFKNNPFQPQAAVRNQDPTAPEQPLTWIGVELKDFDGNPIPDQPFRIVLSRGTVLSGTTDRQGKARFDGIKPDMGRVIMTNLPDNAPAHITGKVYEGQGGPEMERMHASGDAGKRHENEHKPIAERPPMVIEEGDDE
jgi:uncharacterized Zn-binding protein involved in type VI secretion